MYTFKMYDPENNPVFAYSIKELADICDVTREEASKAIYRNVITLNGIKVIVLVN